MENGRDLKQYPQYVYGLMILLNGLTVVFLVLTTITALGGFLKQGQALKLLEQVNSVPAHPARMLLLTVSLSGILFFLFMMSVETQAQALEKLALEVVFALMLCRILNFSYAGIVFLLLADVMRYSLSWKARFIVIPLFILLYFVLESTWIRNAAGVTGTEVFWVYYRQDIRNLLTEILNVFRLLNMFLFILFMIVQILVQMSEKEQILRLNEELRDANQKLERYALDAERMAETRERNRLAREIHDTLGHSLTGIISGLEACIMLMDAAPEATKEQMRAIVQIAREGITDVRQSVKALRPDALESMTLGNALEKSVDDMRRSTGVSIDYECLAELSGMGQDEEEVVYRIVQESTTNAIRHGRADHIRIRITKEDNVLRIHISDNGCGSKEVKEGFGLHHMRERLQMLGGTLSYDGSDGFVIDAALPVRWGT